MASEDVEYAENVNELEDTVLMEVPFRMIRRFEWKIKNYFALSGTRDYITTKIYLADTQWRVRLNPSKCDVSVSIKQIKREKDAYAQLYFFHIGVKTACQSIVKLKEHSSKDCNTFNWNCLIEKYKLLEEKLLLVPDGVLTLVIIAYQENYCEDDEAAYFQGHDLLAKNLKDLYIDGKNTDLTINVGGHKFKAHASILCARSPVFDAMFQHPTKEKESGVIDIENCDPKSFHNFLLFLYSGDLSYAACDNVCDLYKTADKYRVKDLQQACVIHLKHEMTIESFIDTTLIAFTHGEEELLVCAMEFFIRNASVLLKTESWISFLQEHSSIANELLIILVDRK